MDDRKKRRRKANARAIRVGFKLGLLILTAILTVRASLLAIQVAESRAGAFGGEICFIPLVALLFWAGWTFRKEYEDMKEGGTERGAKQSLYPRSEK